MLLLVMFLGTGILPPTRAYWAAENTIVQSLPDAEKLVEQGRRLYEAERFYEAVSLLQQAVGAFGVSGDKLRQAIALSNLSLTYQQLGQWQEAEDTIGKAIAALDGQSLNILETERSQVLAQALEVKGRLQLVRGQAEAALTTWRQAAQIYTQLQDPVGVTRSRINQAQALQTLGLYRQAHQLLTESIELLQNQPDSLLKATALRSLGNVLRVVGDLEVSQQILQQSLAVAQALELPEATADALISLGNIARARADTTAALKFYRQVATTPASATIQVQALLHQMSLLLADKKFTTAIAITSQIQPLIANLPISRTAVYARINLAQSLLKLASVSSEAEKLIKEIAQLLATSVQQAQTLGDRRVESYALGTLGELYEQTHQWSEAVDLTQQALFLAQTIEAQDITYQWQWQMGRLLRNQGNIEAATTAYEQAVNTLQSLRYDLVAINPNVQFDFQERVEPAYRQLVDLLLQPEGTAQPSQKNLHKARNTIEALQLAELVNFFRSACLDAKPELIDQVVDQRDTSSAVIYPIILPNRLEIILKLPTDEKLRHYVTAKPQSEVESLVEQLRQYLREPDRGDDANKLSQQVYEWLIQPLATELERMQVKTLVFVLDGELRNIPMAVLYDGEKYLVEKYAIALAPGLQLLDPKPLPRQRLTALTAGLSEKLFVEGQEFPRLENVSVELQKIQSEIPKTNALFNQDFTKANLEHQISSATYSVVHMATHGKFSSQIEETFILTWNQLLKVRDLDNLLRINDSQKSNSIELLVLSACETATGDKRAALGLAGIAVRAGARSTLATLWSVDDESTAELMSEFYRQLVNTQVTKAEALQLAQMALWHHKNQDWKRPYFWASYVLIGNWL